MIKVGFSRAVGFWSFLSVIIRKVTGRPYSHVWLLLDGNDGVRGVPVVLESNEHGGLHMVPWDGYGVGKVIVKIVDPPIPLDAGVDVLIHRLGTGYDVPGLFGEGIRIMFKEWFKRKIANPLRNSKQMWCSEAVAFAIQTCNYPNMKPDDWQRCTPGDVEDLLEGKTLP